MKKAIRLKVDIYCAERAVPDEGVTSLFLEVTVVAILRAKLPGLSWRSSAAGTNLVAFCQSVLFTQPELLKHQPPVVVRDEHLNTMRLSLSTAGRGDIFTQLQASVQ